MQDDKVVCKSSLLTNSSEDTFEIDHSMADKVIHLKKAKRNKEDMFNDFIIEMLSTNASQLSADFKKHFLFTDDVVPVLPLDQ